ncbi:Protein RDM1 [Corchorus olitorius]|uniref:Protein RDM1 n=1 Tax=Corchorus olitorius TaxID=93759 RepID=A0A1R3JQ64_9ROSI|nr:Protein RDM1 [Corchorus olitorius]
MLKRYNPPKSNHLFLSSSETESDDNYRHRKKINKRKIIRKESKRSNKKKPTPVNGESKEEVSKINEIKEEVSKVNGVSKEEQENEVIKEAEKYQEYMKLLSVPVTVESPSKLPFITWQDLAKSIKQKYGQPLHYLTHNLLKQWDESRANNKNEINNNPIGNVIDPLKAEATLWVVEEFNRQFASHHYIAKLWICDPKYHDFVDSMNPKD